MLFLDVVQLLAQRRDGGLKLLVLALKALFVGRDLWPGRLPEHPHGRDANV